VSYFQRSHAKAQSANQYAGKDPSFMKRPRDLAADQQRAERMEQLKLKLPKMSVVELQQLIKIRWAFMTDEH